MATWLVEAATGNARDRRDEMAAGVFRFDRFVLDPDDRLLLRDGAPADLNARYLDALVLLVRARGQLVSKDRFLSEVWRGVPVTDEALTQCIKMLRRVLGDPAASPRFIETVPKYGYRFIAPVSVVPDVDVGRAAAVAVTSDPMPAWRRCALRAGAGTLGAGAAGSIGGVFYGFGSVAEPGVGAISVMLVLMCVTLAMAMIGGAGVAIGIAAGDGLARAPWRWSVVGGALGGLVIGACVKLLGLDAFQLLLGQSPGNITGAAEGLMLGGAVGLGGWLGQRVAVARSVQRRIAVAALVGAGSGIAIGLAGGRLMGGSLALLAQHMPGARFRIDQIGRLFGEADFGLLSRTYTGALEGALFAGGIVGAIVLVDRHLATRQ